MMSRPASSTVSVAAEEAKVRARVSRSPTWLSDESALRNSASTRCRLLVSCAMRVSSAWVRTTPAASAGPSEGRETRSPDEIWLPARTRRSPDWRRSAMVCRPGVRNVILMAVT